jgi:hypothetical protein
MKLSLYCTCGASGTGTIKPDAKAEKFKTMWLETHSGPGHAPCDQKTAARARAKSERELDAEEMRR